jgi:Fe-S-cluster containining protein
VKGTDKMAKVDVYKTEEDGKQLVGLRVNDDSATLQDLLDAWQPLCDDTSVHKMYAPAESSICKGCLINCCNTAYVVPDVISFKKMAAWFDYDYEQLLHKFFDQEKREAGLLRLKPNPCVFLQNNICTIYPVRTLTCRFYLCADTVGDTQQLIYSVTWAGIAAAQVFAEKQGLVTHNPQIARSSFDLLIDSLINEYRDSDKITSFLNAREYADVLIKPFIP